MIKGDYMIILSIGALVGSYFLYKNFFPVFENCIDPYNIECNEGTMMVDLRDYQSSDKYPIKGAVVLPFAYLKRYHDDLKGKKLYIVAPGLVDRNLSIRFLKNKGYEVIGYSIVKENQLITDELQFEKCC
ncbi:hypothetical protein RJD24_09875 [Bacillaceae bacterium IKA-2]|nr:hypothetical protein RJD24_09875 [Bacillaceae bacterium IKA-2]